MLRFKYPYIHSQSLLLLRSHFFRVEGFFIAPALVIRISIYQKIITRDVSRDYIYSSIVMLVVMINFVTRDVSRDEFIIYIGYIFV